MSAAMAPSEYLKRPYGRVVLPEPDGTFRAEIIEFPGCLATGETAAEALASLEAIAEGWLEATIARGLPVPEPIDGASHSGKLVVRLGKDLHRRSAHVAAGQGVSLNQLIVSSVAEHVGRSAWTFWTLMAQSQPLHGPVMLRVGLSTWRQLSDRRGDFQQAATPTGGVTIPIAHMSDDTHA